MAGLEPATLRLEVSRASITPHGQLILYFFQMLFILENEK